MKRNQWLILGEAIAVFGAIMLYIWRLRYTAPYAAIPIVAGIILAQILHRDPAAKLGFRRANFRECFRIFGPGLLLIVALLLAAGAMWGMRPMGVRGVLLGLAAYCVWGLFQQYLLNSYLANRLLALASERRVPLIAATIFSLVHLPNWFLMAVTFGAGYASTLIFMKYRNLYFLGLVHGLIGTLLFVVIPDSISHHLRVGPGFFTH